MVPRQSPRLPQQTDSGHFFINSSVADPDPGSGRGRNQDPGGVEIRIRIQDEQTGSYFRELEWGLKCLNSLMQIRDRKISDYQIGGKQCIDGQRNRVRNEEMVK